MSRASLVVVLAEDEPHQRFVRRYLERLGYSGHDIRFESVPAGRGCGEQWVRKRYASAILAYRARSTRAQTALVVVIDADKGDVETRLRQLREALVSTGSPPRMAAERIAHFVPKRNVETWILWLNGRAVSEEDDCSHESIGGEQVKTAAATFHRWTRPNTTLPDNCLASLRAAIPEATRLE